LERSLHGGNNGVSRPIRDEISGKFKKEHEDVCRSTSIDEMITTGCTCSSDRGHRNDTEFWWGIFLKLPFRSRWGIQLRWTFGKHEIVMMRLIYYWFI
jgi:hypothetical protein